MWFCNNGTCKNKNTLVGTMNPSTHISKYNSIRSHPTGINKMFKGKNSSPIKHFQILNFSAQEELQSANLRENGDYVRGLTPREKVSLL